jgi:hypothetical protein
VRAGFCVLVLQIRPRGLSFFVEVMRMVVVLVDDRSWGEDIFYSAERSALVEEKVS